jgi:uncharacterized protein YndB with AHSA1/START domain
MIAGMEPLERIIDIDATPATVWRIMTDVQRWPEWTASVRRVERLDAGDLATGSRARLWIKGSMTASTWTVTRIAPGASFSWESRILPGVTSIADHEIAPRDGGVRVTLRVSMRGPLAGVAARALNRVSNENLDLESQGLKRAAEAATG